MTADLGLLQLISDMSVSGAFLAIASAVSIFVLRKHNLPFRAVLWLFTAFALASGASHLMEAAVYWWPAHRLTIYMKMVTAILSWAIVIALVSLAPRALAKRSARKVKREIDESKGIDARLPESEQLFRQMTESIREIFWMQVGGWKQTLYVSPAYEAVWGRTCESLYQNPLSWFDGVHPDDRAPVKAQVEQQLRGISTDTEFRVARPDGSLRWVRCHAFPIKGPLGEVSRVTGIAEDITDRKQAQEALRESEARFRGTFDNAAVGIAHVDAEGRFLFVNDKLCDIVGYTRQELLAKGFQDITHPDDLATSLDHFRSLMRGELPSFSLEKRHLRKDGSVFWGNVSLSIQTRSVGEPAYGIAILQDISELKKVEEKLRRASERLELAVRSSNIALGELDITAGPNGPVEWLNYWEQWGTGNPEVYPTAESMRSLVHPEDRDEVARLSDAFFKGEVEEFKSVHRVQHRDGSYHWALVRGVLFRDTQGRPIRSSGSVIDVNDLKRAEENLRESEERFRGTFENAAVGIAHMDRQNRCLRANEKLGEVLGYPSAELVGKTLQEVVHPDDLEPNLALFDLLVRGELPSFSMDKRFIHKDGASVWTHVTASIQRDAAGQPAYCIAIVQDISERKRLEAGLSQTHANLNLALQGSSLNVWEIDMPDGILEHGQVRLLNWDQLGYDRPGPTQSYEAFIEPVHPEDRDLVHRAAVAYLYGESTEFEVEHRAIRRDGICIWVLSRAVAVRDAQGKPIRLLGSFIDITAVKRAEEAVRHSEERFRGTFENAAVGIVHKDLTGEFLLVNNKFCDIVGYTRDELLTRSWQDITFPDDVSASLEKYGSLMQGEATSFSLEKRYLCKDHSLVWVDITVSLQRDAAGSPSYAIAIVQDISERKKLEGELRQAKDVAEAANRAKDEFLANVSHEIRTPMNAILGMTELALDTPLRDDQRQYLKTVRSAADNLLGIINDLLDFSRIEAGKLELHLDGFFLRAALGDTLRALAIRAHKKGLELVSQVQSDVPDALVGDVGRLRQSLLNLIGNAIKFTAEGEVVVRVDVASDSVPEEEVGLRFTVTDTGIGIPPEKQETIFRAFEQEDTSTTRKYGGTGLGLTIASRLVALMGGRITVDSQPGRGSTFSFTARFGLQSRQPESVASCPPVLLRYLRALIVDDNLTNRRILEQWLRGWQMEAAAVGDGLAALNALWHAVSLGRPFPLMILDARMPDTDGLALAARLREHNELSSTRIILLTSGDRPGDLARARQLGINAHLLKPVQQEELLETIYQVMSRPDSQSTIDARSAPARELSEGLGTTGTPLRILLAEDNEFNAQHLEGLLVRRDCIVRVANNGREALALLGIDEMTSGTGSVTTPGPSPTISAAGPSSTTWDFDLVLLDLHMPELDGFQVARVIREQERATGGHLPVIALTARSRKEDREHCLAAGMDDYLSKPIRSVELFGAIDRVLFDRGISQLSQPDAGGGTSLLDPVVLLGACGDDEEGLRGMKKGFQVYLPRRMAEVADALRSEDAPQLRMAAHKLCGLLSAFSTVACGVASILEDRATSDRLDECRTLVEQLEVMTRELVQQVDSLSIESLRQQVGASGDAKSH